MTKGIKKTCKESGVVSYLIVLFVLISLGATIVLLQNYKYINLSAVWSNKNTNETTLNVTPSSIPTLYPSITKIPLEQVDSPALIGEINQSPKKEFNLDTILKEKFIQYRISKIGLSFEYPEESYFYQFNQTEASAIIVQTFDISHVITGIRIIFTPLPKDAGTQLYDGLSVKIYYQTANNLTLEQITNKSNLIKDQLNGIPCFKKVSDNMGHAEGYYFLDKTKQYLINIEVYYQNSDGHNYEAIANRIISSFKLN